MTVWVRVMPKGGVLDPQGKAIADALHRLGYDNVEDARAGKLFRIEVAATDTKAATDLGARLAEKLLANPVIEDYDVWVEVAPAGVAP